MDVDAYLQQLQEPLQGQPRLAALAHRSVLRDDQHAKPLQHGIKSQCDGLLRRLRNRRRFKQFANGIMYYNGYIFVTTNLNPARTLMLRLKVDTASDVIVVLAQQLAVREFLYL